MRSASHRDAKGARREGALGLRLALPIASVLAFACGAPKHAPLLDDHHALKPMIDAGIDTPSPKAMITDASIDEAAAPKPKPEPAVKLPPCMSSKQAATYTDPLIGDVGLFDSDYFSPVRTEPRTGEAQLKAVSRDPDVLSCAKTGASGFELFGGAQTQGPLLVLPQAGANFFPTLIQKVSLAAVDVGVVPTFATKDIDSIFDQLGLDRDPDLGQMVFEFVLPTQVSRERFSNIQVHARAAKAIAYRNEGEWTRDLDRTTEDGIAMLLNVEAKDGFGAEVEVGYTNYGTDPPTQITLAGMLSRRGSITYNMILPEGVTQGAEL